MNQRSRPRQAGLPPATPVHIGERHLEEPKVFLVEFSTKVLRTREINTADIAKPPEDSSMFSWIDVIGLHDIPFLEKLGKVFGIHPLVIEDIANTRQRPKIEISEDQIFMIAKILRSKKGERLKSSLEQVSLIIGENFLLTFREKQGPIFDPIREHLQMENSRLRRNGPDFLAHALLDAIVDNYLIVLEETNEGIDELEEAVLRSRERDLTGRVHRLKRRLTLIHRVAWPFREMVSAALREDSSLIKPATRPFLRDLNDQAIHAVETADLYRETIAGLLEIHLGNVNVRMAEVMKVLTVIATIFIPPTFVAGVYGMNFHHIPEHSWRWGYPAALVLMAAMVVSMLVYLRLRRWV